MGWFAGSSRGIDSLVEAHYVALYRYAFRLSGIAQTAEDLTQETFCQAQAKIHQLREPSRAKAWLFAILRNAYLHRLRAIKLEKQVPLEDLPELPERVEDSMPEVDSAGLQAALNQLPETFRTPIILYYFEEFSYREIAEHMDVPLGTVMSRLARAKAFLRQRLVAGDMTEKAN